MFWQETIGGNGNTRDNQVHPKNHFGIHGHAREDKARIVTHPEHRQMQQNTDGDGEAAQAEGPDPASIKKNLGADHLQLRCSFWSRYLRLISLPMKANLGKGCVYVIIDFAYAIPNGATRASVLCLEMAASLRILGSVICLLTKGQRPPRSGYFLIIFGITTRAIFVNSSTALLAPESIN